MHTAKLADITTNRSLFSYFASWRDVHPAWSYCAAGYTLLMLACLIAGAFDERLLNGVFHETLLTLDDRRWWCSRNTRPTASLQPGSARP